MSSTHLESDLAHTWVYIEGPKGVQGAGFSANGTHNTFNIMKLNKQTGLREVEVGEEAKTVQLGDRIRTSQAVNPTKNLGKQSHWGQTGKRQQETHRQAQVKWIRAGLKAQTHIKIKRIVLLWSFCPFSCHNRHKQCFHSWTSTT